MYVSMVWTVGDKVYETTSWEKVKREDLVRLIFDYVVGLDFVAGEVMHDREGQELFTLWHEELGWRVYTIREH